VPRVTALLWCYHLLVQTTSRSGSLINSFRVFRERRAYEPNANDLSALSKIGHFEFGLESVEIPFYKCAESDEEDALTYQDELRIA